MTRIIDFHAHLDERWFHVPCDSPSSMVATLDRFEVEAACVFTIMGFYEDCVRPQRGAPPPRERVSGSPDSLRDGRSQARACGRR